MSENVSVKDQAIAEAERINAERMKVVEDLATAVEERVELERLLAEAQKKEKRLMTEAEKVGWTRKQVSSFAKPPKRSTSKQQTNSSTGSSGSAPASSSVEEAPGSADQSNTSGAQQ